MADSTQQNLWSEKIDELLASPQKTDRALERVIWGWEQRIDLLRSLAAHALTSGQPLVAAELYQQLAHFVEKCRNLRNCLGTPRDS